MIDDTICSISTAPGNGAISIVRVSGKDAISIVNKIFNGKNLETAAPNTINYGKIISNDEIIDEVLVSIFKGPKSYTAEDVVEINTHGGIISTNEVLSILLEKGCRLAEPGEFTKRAFLNGRISLSQAEAVNDLLISKTSSAKKLAIQQVNGKLTNFIREIRKQLVDLISNIEVNIDFPEYEDILEMNWENTIPVLNDIYNKLNELEKTSKDSKLINNGIKVALVGRPNVGKSSLLNAFLDEEKAIVTNIAGTTRDIIEGNISINGISINFIDTAGIRETTDLIEQIGVKKSIDVIESSDLNILVLNNNEELTEEDLNLYDLIKNKKNIIFINKNDLESKLDYSKFKNVVVGNTKSINGILNLKNKIKEVCELKDFEFNDQTYLSNVRQLDLVKKAKSAIEEALKNANLKYSIDMIEMDIRNAWNLLGEITGDNYSEELLDNLFKNFCLGK